MNICNARRLWQPLCLTALVVLLFIAASRTADADDVNRTSDSSRAIVTAKVSGTTVQVAEPLTLELTVTASAGSQVDFPSVGKSLGSFDVTNQTDRADVPSASDSGKRVWTRRLTLESIITGDMEIPALEILVRSNAGSQTLKSEAIPVRVTSVLEDRADPTQFRDIQSVVDVEVPQPASRAWLWWTLGGLGGVVMAALLFMAVAKRKTWMTPNIWAIRELEQLRNSDAMKSIDSDTITENLTTILRDYLELQFDIAAPVQTTRELLLAIETGRCMSVETIKGFSDLFESSDLARFAGLNLTHAELTKAIDDAQRLMGRNRLTNTRYTTLAERRRSEMFASPWYFLFLLLLPFVAWRLFAPRRRSAVRFSSVSLAKQLTPTLRQRMAWLPGTLTIAAVLAMIVGLAQPREGREQTVTDSEGIAIEMVVDRSGSMQALDFQVDGEHVDRLTAIKNVAGKFVAGGGELEGRFSDLVGLIAFAGYADGETPPTLDHAFLVSQLNNTQIVTNRREDGTAIGDAISLAVEKLNALDARQKEKVRSKIIILLTDGENNAGQLDPIQAAELAETMGIKVYTIGVGTKGQAPMPVEDPFTGRTVMQLVPVSIDEETLTKVASLTGGKYYRATDTDSLEKIYNEIDQLEKTKVEAHHFVDYRELAIQPYTAAGFSVPPVLFIAFMLLAARLLLQQTWLREMT